jgi:hypothetical protein
VFNIQPGQGIGFTGSKEIALGLGWYIPQQLPVAPRLRKIVGGGYALIRRYPFVMPTIYSYLTEGILSYYLRSSCKVEFIPFFKNNKYISNIKIDSEIIFGSNQTFEHQNLDFVFVSDNKFCSCFVENGSEIFTPQKSEFEFVSSSIMEKFENGSVVDFVPSLFSLRDEEDLLSLVLAGEI